jgi:UDP-glucose 4-epimerase
MGRSKLYFDFIMQIWPLGKLESWAARQPLLRRFIHLDISPERNQHIIIPVNQVIRGTESVVLPPMVVETLIDHASHHVAMNQCLCRRAEHCHSFPREIGCLFLGDAAGQINPELCRVLNPEDAKAYARHAIKIGLMPMIVHSAFDAELLGIDFRRMLAICFCCDCCCTVRQNLRNGPREFGDTVLRFPGLRVEAGQECTGCGICLEVCHAHALSLVDGRLVVGESCKGCGSCALACPIGAIHLNLDETSQAMERLLALVEERTTIG